MVPIMSVHAGSIWIDQNFTNVPQDLWVAVGSTGIVAEGRDLTLLMNFLASRQVPLAQVTITFLISGTLQ